MAGKEKDQRVGSYVGKETEREKEMNEKDFFRYVTPEYRGRMPLGNVYDPDSPYLKRKVENERKYLESAKTPDERVRKLQAIAASTDENVPIEKAKYRRGHIATNEALYGMKKGGKVSSASARADGIAQRGKTRGKIC
jgi:hypothetical protein